LAVRHCSRRQDPFYGQAGNGKKTLLVTRRQAPGFSSNRRGHFDLYEKSADGSENEELLYESAIQKYCQGWSPDGKSLTLMTVNNANRDIWTFPLSGDRKLIPYLQTECSEQKYPSPLTVVVNWDNGVKTQ